MYQWQPSQWIKWTPALIVPLLGGAFFSTHGLVDDVANRVKAAAGDWAKVEMDHRDAKISGEVASQDAIDAAVKAVAGTYGVRTVDVSNVKIVAPVALAAPTIESVTTNNAVPEIKGTWPEGIAKSLAVTLNNKTYELNKDAELQSNAGAWILKPAAALADGAYDVTASVSDGATTVVAAAAPAKVVVDTMAPAAPTIAAPAAGAAWPYAVTGTWPEGDANTLIAKLADKTYQLGKDDALKSDGKGNFVFEPKADLKPGQYDLDLSLLDAAGNKTDFSAKSAIVVADSTAPAPAVVKLDAPTVVVTSTNKSSPVLTGSYPKEAAKLSVDLAGKTFALGTDKELTTDAAGTWTLQPGKLVDGSYTATAHVSDEAGALNINSQPQTFIVDTVAPALPTINAAPADAVWPYAITGTWPEGDAVAMSLSLAGKAYALGKDKELISDGKGTFTFAPAADLKPGKYSIDVTVIDAVQNIKQSVIRDAIVIPEPTAVAVPAPAVVLTAPTIESATFDKDLPIVKGTWPAGIAKSLSVALGGQTYILGKDSALLSDDAGHWTLTPTKPLANGVYDVVAEVGDGAGATAKDATVGELEINVPPPPAPPVVEPAKPAALPVPTVEASISDSDHPTVKGTWAPGIGRTLVVSLDGASYKLGKDFDLLSNAAGSWTLRPKAAIVNGTYDVIAQVADDAGQTAIDATKDELKVNVAPPPPAPPAGQPYDCVTTMARISAVFPVRFEFNKDTLATPYDLAANQYASLLKDSRCLSMKVQVGGHADYKGSEAYNQGLSERRAKTVIDALVAAGIDASRLTGVGYSKDKPLDPALTDSARMKNRRVEFTVLN